MEGQNTTFLMVMLINILVSGVFIVVAIYFILILRDLKGLSGKAKLEGEKILDDVEDVRKDVKRNGRNAKNVIKNFLGIKGDRK